MVFTVILRPSLPVTAIRLLCAFPSTANSCSHRGLWSGRSGSQPSQNPFSSSPAAAFRRYPAAPVVAPRFAGSLLPHARPAPFAQGPHWPQAVFAPVHRHTAGLPSGSRLHQALDFTTLSSAIRGGLECTSIVK